MTKKLMSFKTKGMNRDLSVSAFNPEFAFENMNLRLATKEGNTMMSWVNEKGTSELETVTNTGASFVINGTPIGTAVLNEWLVLFTTGSIAIQDTPDYIYKIKYNSDKTKLVCNTLFSGNLNFSADHPLETMVYYEEDSIQKVYWVDGINQPRMINICNPQKGITVDGIATNFDFVTSFSTGSLSVVKNASGGMFAAGVIQYCFSYIQKNGQQTNLVDISPLYYISYENRGASPEDKTSNSFTLTLSNLNSTEFDCVRIYSIQRTSLNATPVVKLLRTLTIASTLTYTDTGMDGSIIDPTELLYIGGMEIIAGTLADKDNTLFLGNITKGTNYESAIQTYYRNYPIFKDLIGDSPNFVSGATIDITHNDGAFYSYHPTLNKSNREITTFKGNERYRFGFQLMKATGEWTEPIWIGDETNKKYPTVSGNNVTLVKAAASITGLTSIVGVDTSVYKKARPVIVYPNTAERKVLCQGVLNPTVFNAQDRIDNSPFAQASWYFRPFTTDTPNDNTPSGGADPTVVINGDRSNPDYVYPSTSSSVTRNAPLSALRNLSGDSYYPNNSYFSDYMGSVDIIVALVDTNSGLSNIQNGLRDAQGGWCTFDGIIDLGTLGDSSLASGVQYVAFIKKNYMFPQLAVRTTGGSLDSYCIISYKACTINRPQQSNNRFFNMSERLKTATYRLNNTDFQHYYYVQQENAPENVTPPTNIYYFDFYVDSDTQGGSDYFDVAFGAGRYGVTNKVYHPLYPDQNPRRQGSALVYKHYGSIPDAQSVLDTYTASSKTSTDVTAAETGIKSVEIQGSKNVYSDWWYTAAQTNIDSNTQFFVDQHIVTLNSPDVEFDTEVQCDSFDNLKLRIVGYIPISSSASAHNISISSAKVADGTNVGRGELDVNVRNSYNLRGLRLVGEYLWSDAIISGDSNEEETKTLGIFSFMVHPWNRSGSLNNDFRSASIASSLLKTKRESNILFSKCSNYLSTSAMPVDADVVADMHLTEHSEVRNYKLGDYNYYPNIDKILYNGTGYRPKISDHDIDYDGIPLLYTPVSMKYCSTSHVLLRLGETQSGLNTTLKTLPGSGTNSHGADQPFWDTDPNNQHVLTWTPMTISPALSGTYLLLGELYRDGNDATIFGGDTDDALKSNLWHIAGNTVNITDANNIPLEWTAGDTFFQRYDCLKTYPFTREDPNQIVEILSFMCETHVNLDGRYDRNRGQIDNTNMSPQNFNLLNPVYSQKDNYFGQRVVEYTDETSGHYPNLVYFSKTKTPGADVDLYTNVTLASTLDLDGDKGEITNIRKFNDMLIAFQEKGISQILYNENVQIASTTGVPIEIANSGKVQGKRYLSDSVGCSNKWSIVDTPSGIYFMNNYDKNIYVFNGQLSNLSAAKGFDAWCKTNILTPDITWKPVSGFGNGWAGYYDAVNQDVLFINKDTALAYSEKLGVFTSFYDYGDTPYFCNLEDTGLWMRNPYSVTVGQNTTSYNCKIWKHQGGNYCSFFGVNKPYWMTVVGNPEPQTDKIFTNIEFRACVEGDGEPTQNASLFAPTLPFDSIESWNEYQHGKAFLKDMRGHRAFQHNLSDSTASLKRKFRIWRCDIPRDNMPVDIVTESPMGIYRKATHSVDRMRNPWLYMKLIKDAVLTDAEVETTNSSVTGAVKEGDVVPGTNPQQTYTKQSANEHNRWIPGTAMYADNHKTEIHDLLMTYFN